MRTIEIKIKYKVGDKVWIMKDNFPTLKKITTVHIQGGYEDERGATPGLGRAEYCLGYDNGKRYSEGELCDTFEQLRDRVFSAENNHANMFLYNEEED